MRPVLAIATAFLVSLALGCATKREVRRELVKVVETMHHGKVEIGKEMGPPHFIDGPGDSKTWETLRNFQAELRHGSLIYMATYRIYWSQGVSTTVTEEVDQPFYIRWLKGGK